MKSVIVTGASGNLGKAVVEKFVSSGYRVIGTKGKNEIANPAMEGVNAEFHQVDLLEEKESDAFVQQVIQKHGNVDVAVLTVGGFAMGNIENTGSAELEQMFRLNFLASYNVARPVFNQMMKQGSGRIFLVGAMAGIDTGKSGDKLAYGLSKSLVLHLAEILNTEAAHKDVVTSVVVPSVIDTPQNRKSMPGADHQSWVRPESIAEIIFFYTTPKAASIRQPVIKVYGNV